ncbi:MAG: DUF2723 domain-containing protein [Prevotella sp.]|nr:DUF2723 domain-containing protein [Prevotella sp.]
MKHFHRIDTLLGWLAFAIAATVYGLTIEPTASFWDCPEFILAGYKLETGHPPGAPFFMLAANLFTQIGGSASRAAMMVNLLSALLSALTILFLFWTISHLVRLIVTDGDRWALPSPTQTVSIEGAAFTGALVYTFSDTFWFSAVEGEVYAFSSAFTAAVFWLILKWDDHADQPQSDRWLVLIAYLMGLSIGVHLLNLLCLPAIVLVFCFRRFPAMRLWGAVAAVLASFVLIAAILFVIIPGVTTVGGWFELLFVNHLGMPFNSGLLAYLIILFPTLILAIAWSQRRQLRVVNTSLLAFLMLLLGYGSYAVTFVRASANPPMNQNAPKDVFALGRYLARDQYEHGPLLYGQAYSSQPSLRIDGNYCVPETKQGKTIYQQKPKQQPSERDQYIVTGHHFEHVYAQQMWFPRMWNPRYADAYQAWAGSSGGNVVWYDRCGEMVPVTMPTQWDNLRFFLNYQCGFMYWRYFLWNFAGRQNDLQGHGEPEHGNWLSGFAFIDNWRLGDQRLLPASMKANRGHNVYYCLPLLLGLLGICWQTGSRRREAHRQFWVVTMLFLMTGLAIVVYINQTPMQPRERDYAYAGSFYAFAIWCGMGAAAVSLAAARMAATLRASHVCPKLCVGSGTAAALFSSFAAAISLLVPVQMATQNWDDHDRSGRYICRDAGHNYLASLPEDGAPIILTNGDNDTFPLWYVQEVEGERRDARVCNLQYLQTDWYIDQLRRPAYDSPPLPIDWQPADYITGQNDVYDLSDLHTDTLHLSDRWDVPLRGRRTLYKNELALLELLRHSDDRPVYVATSVGAEDYLNLDDHIVIEGLAARFTPDSQATAGEAGKTAPPRLSTERTFHNLMTRFRFTGIADPHVYHDETARNMAYRYRRLFAQLALALISEQKATQARQVLARCDEVLPQECLPADYLLGSDLDIARAYVCLGMGSKAHERFEALATSTVQLIRYYLSLSPSLFATCHTSCLRQLYMLRNIAQEASAAGDALADQLWQMTDSLYTSFEQQGGQIDAAKP